MKSVEFKLKHWLIISPFTLAFISLPSRGLAIDVKDVPKLSSASQELTQESHLPWVPLAGGRALVLALAATHYISRRQRRKLVKPSGYTSQVSSNQGYSQRYNYVHWDSRPIKIDVDVDVDIDVDNCDANNSARSDLSDLLDSCENRSDESTSSNFGDGSSDASNSYGNPESSDSSSPWSRDESDRGYSSDTITYSNCNSFEIDREYTYEPSDCNSYESGSSLNSDTSSCSNYDSESSWNSDSSESSWSSDSSDSSWSSGDSSWSSDSSSSSDYGGGSSDGGGADSSW